MVTYNCWTKCQTLNLFQRPRHNFVMVKTFAIENLVGSAKKMPTKSIQYIFCSFYQMYQKCWFTAREQYFKTDHLSCCFCDNILFDQKNISFWTFNVINGNNHVVVSNRKHSTKFWPTQVGPGELPDAIDIGSVVVSSIEKKVRTKVYGNKFCMAVTNAGHRRKIFGYEFDGSV